MSRINDAFARLESGMVCYNGAPHGLCTTQKQQANEDLLAFLKDEG